MDFTNWRFSSPSSCEYQASEGDPSPGMNQPSPESIMGFKIGLLSFQTARNQEDWFRKYQDTINFLKPAKPTTIWGKLPTNSIWPDPNLLMGAWRCSRPTRRHTRRP
ncbi:hypothetical protein Bca4012_063678 [Brassica carinata]